MSKFFYRCTPDVMSNYGKAGYQPNANVKLGTKSLPLALSVQDQQRADDIQTIVDQHELVATITIDNDVPENILELDAVLNKPKTQRFEKTPDRNDPCLCGSGKKYKKCCG